MGDDRPKPRQTGCTTGSPVLTPPTGIPAAPDDTTSLLAPIPADDAADDQAAPSAAPAPGAAAPVATTPTPPADVAVSATSCLCGHEAEAHEHWRRGSDCGVCGPATCPVYRRCGGRLRRILRRLRLVH